MKLEEAIKIVVDGQDMARPFLLTGYEEAIKLLIEAGKDLREHRKYPLSGVNHLLPGETP